MKVKRDSEGCCMHGVPYPCGICDKALADSARGEAETDLLLISIPGTPADRCWCYWYVN